MLLSYFTRILMGVAIFGLLSSVAAAQNEPVRIGDVGGALEDLDQALAGNTNLDTETKSALLNLSDALRADQQSAHTRLTDASLVNYSSNLGGDKGCGCKGKGCDWCAKEIKLPGNTCVMSFFGDFRLRHESIYITGPTHNRHRERLRFRFGANFEISEELTVGFRARSGNGDDPNSPHHTFSNAFDSINFNLDRAFAKYNPYWAPSLTVYGGKFGNPMVMNPVYGELVWDADINPEGLAFVWEGENARAVVGGYVVDERNGGAPVAFEDTTLITAQISGSREIDSNSSISGALGYYYYSNLTPNGTTTSLADNNFERRGNLMVGAPELYASDFEILDAYMAYDTTIRCVPVVISGEYIKNDAAINNEDEGYAVGVAAGSTSEPGGRQFFYQYQDIEQEAVFAGFVNDDFPYATNYHGHVIGMNQKLGKATVVRIWALNSERSSLDASPTDRFPDSSRWTFRADMNIKF